MSMTVAELVELLGSLDQSAEVRIMSQPNYPFEYSIEGVWENEYDDTDDSYEDGDGDDANTGPKPVFIVEGNQRGYGTKRAWREVIK